MKFYIGSVQTWLESLDDNAGEFAEYIASAVRYINNFIDKAYELIRNVIPQIAGAAKNIVVTVKDMLLGLYLQYTSFSPKNAFRRRRTKPSAHFAPTGHTAA